MNFELEWLRGFFLSNDTDCNLGELTSFNLSGSDLHLKQNHSSKQKGVFHLTIKNRWASFCQVTATCRGYTNTTTNLSAVCTGEFLWNLCLRNRILSPQHVGAQKNQIRENLCDLSPRQNSVAEKKIFSQKFSGTHEVICRCDVSP